MDRTEVNDLYEILQVSPRAHPLVVTKAFRLLAAIYHPDNPQTGDEERFKQLGQAYAILGDPARRAAYDRDYFGGTGPRNAGPTNGDESSNSAQLRALDEQELRSQILRALYDVRRSRPYQPGVSLMVLSELLGCSIENMQYSLWYLRGKQYIDTTNDSDLVITVDGVDAIEVNGFTASAPRSEKRIATFLSLPSLHDAAPESPAVHAGKRNGDGSSHQG